MKFQLDGRTPTKREIGLQKSVSQQHISTKAQPHLLSASKSTMSLVKPEDSSKKKEHEVKEPEVLLNQKENEISNIVERNKSVSNIPERIDKQENEKERIKSEVQTKIIEKSIANGPVLDNLK